MGLVVSTVAVYAQVAQFDFVNLGDPAYVTQNRHVLGGLTWRGVAWAFTWRAAANWFPLTWLSHMFDCQLFGLGSGGHHAMNLFFHTLSTLLLFAFLERATKARWRSAAVAFLFALHPLHVESVAWVADRKDVLSAFFWFLTLWAYARYRERPDGRRYALALASFCLGLMATPMAVTLPFVLLLLDDWPLRRVQMTWQKALWEKAPFFAISAIVATVTCLVKAASGALQPGAIFPLGLRVENALASYMVYVAKMFWPTDLAVFYPYPASVPVWQAALAGFALLGISVLVLQASRNDPYLAVGWLWYLGTLAPVIGLVQVGAQARADRYAYIPLVGLFIMLVWGATGVVERWPRARKAGLVLAAAGCSSCCALSAVQGHYWRNSESLFRHALDVTDRNSVAERHLGVALAEKRGKLPEAIWHLEAAVRLEPDDAEAHNHLGVALSASPGRLPEAISEFQTALRIAPGYRQARTNLEAALAKDPERWPESIPHQQAAAPAGPDSAEAHSNLGSALVNAPGRLPEAISEYEAALRLKPDSAEVHYNLGAALAKTEERLPEAISQYEEALRLKPGYAEAENNLGVAYSLIPGRLPDAIEHFEAALRIRPEFADAHYNLGIALSNMPGRTKDAMEEFEESLRIKPDPEVQEALERLRARGR